MNSDKFAKIANSLREYQRAELKNFEEDIGENAVDKLYVDPLQNKAILKTVLSNKTTFLIGRQGTGKSTIFAKAQSEISKSKERISIYIDVKDLYEKSNDTISINNNSLEEEISKEVLKSHMLKKNFLAKILSKLIEKFNKLYDELSIINFIQKKKYQDIINDLEKISRELEKPNLTEEEIPILDLINKKSQDTFEQHEKVAGEAQISVQSTGGSFQTNLNGMEETLSNNQIYTEYSQVILRTLPFSDILQKIETLLDKEKKALVVFFDDFSELDYIDQRLFVDTILSRLNSANNQFIQLKVACYPGRIYYGDIEPKKIDKVSLDFYSLYRDSSLSKAENKAISYTKRLLEKRFEVFGEDILDYFDLTVPMSKYMELMFQVTLNVPRIMGYILHFCYLNSISNESKITLNTIKFAAEEYYENHILEGCFDQKNHYVSEPFEKKLDRYTQKELLKHLKQEAKNVKKGIMSEKIGGEVL